MFGGFGPRVPPSKPLAAAPPVEGKRAPTLLLGLEEWNVEELGDVLRNDLIFSQNNRWNPLNLPTEVKLKILNFLDGKSLLQLTKAYGGSIIVPEDDLYKQESGGQIVLRPERLEALRGEAFQAIVVGDTLILRDAQIRSFVAQQYHEHNVSVVVMGIEGIFDLSPLQDSFGVDWRLDAYTKRYVQLTDMGRKVLSEDAFPFEQKYTKAQFIVGDNDLFSEWIHPEDYLSESDDEDDEDARELRQPTPGSPVVVHGEGDARVSYFGFVNSLDVSWGAIVLRLCYAAKHMDPKCNTISPSITPREKDALQHSTEQQKPVTSSPVGLQAAVMRSQSSILQSVSLERVMLVLIVAVWIGLYFVQEEPQKSYTPTP